MSGHFITFYESDLPAENFSASSRIKLLQKKTTKKTNLSLSVVQLEINVRITSQVYSGLYFLCNRSCIFNYLKTLGKIENG